MKYSINKIFKNLNLFLLIILSLALIGFLFVLEQYYSYEKVNSLTLQKSILFKINNNQQNPVDIDMIQINSSIAMINNEINILINQNNHNYISQFITQSFKDSSLDLKQLKSSITNYHHNLQSYTNRNELVEINSLNDSIVKLIDLMLIKNISYDNEKFNIFSKLFVLLSIILFITTIWYKNRLKNIYNDISHLSSIDADKKDKIFFSQEADAINLKMKKKSSILDNPNMIDVTTQIYNNKGMMQAYTEKKSLKGKNFSSIAILEIDNFSKSKRTFSQEFAKDILKKVAYTISLYKQGHDITARTDYNQFTLIFSRASKEQLFKDVDLIRQNISELKLTSPEKNSIKITVTGSFLFKPNNASLEEFTRKSKELLEKAKQLSTNKIIQIKDIPN